MTLRLILTIIAAVAIPVVGFVLAQIGLADLTSDRVAYFSFEAEAEAICRGSSATVFGGPSAICVDAARLSWLRDVSAVAAVVTLVLLLVYAGAALIAGANRALNAAIFPWLTPIAIWTVALLVLAQGVILTGVVALLIQGLSDLVFWIIVGIVGGGAFLGAISMISVLRAATVEKPMGVLARALTRGEAPALWAFVDTLAEKIGARRPQTLLVGLEPTFFATAAPVVTPESARPTRGETLYLSLPLMRLFTEAELKAVVGHELGHFHGADTAYSLRFAPLYRRLVDAIEALTGADGRPDSLASLPGMAILSFMLELFARNERRISRKRELAADKVGASVASPRDIAVSLAKVAVYAPLWAKIRADNVSRLSAGKIARNLSKIYSDAALYDVNHHAIGDYLGRVLETEIAHPTDSHPPIAERFASLGFDPGRLSLRDLVSQGEDRPLLEELVETEEALTLIEHRLMIENGHADAPSGAKEDMLLNAAYILAATMAAIDESVDKVEIDTAERIGSQIFIGFDPVSFRETFDQLDELPPFLAVVDLLARPLSRAHLETIHGYLSEIAAADGRIDPAEKRLLDVAARRWGLTRGIDGLRRRLRRPVFRRGVA